MTSLKTGTYLLLLLIMGMYGSGCTYSAESAETEGLSLFVSPDAPDNGDGSQSNPFNDIQTALHSVQQMDDVNADTVTINLQAGTYSLQEPLRLASEVNNNGQFVLTIRALNPENTLISGGKKVDSWELHDATLNIYRADLNEHNSQTRQLYVNGQRATRARTAKYPANYKPQFTSSAHTNGIQYYPAGVDLAPADWQKPERVNAVMHTQWKMMSVPVAGVKENNSSEYGLLTMQEPAWTNANRYYDKDSEAPGIWSFWRVSYFENSYSFLNEPGEWYHDEEANQLYYIPREGEHMSSADVQMPVLETLVEGQGTADSPLKNIAFEGITFAYATWMTPDTDTGYVADQSGNYVVGSNNPVNTTGHVQNVKRTAGNLQFSYTHHLTISNCTFTHMGGVALDLGLGCKHNTIANNIFNDISSAAIQLGGATADFHHPDSEDKVLSHNSLLHNRISYTAQEYVDAAAIFAPFTSHTDISFNSISHTNWSGIALGWGWGLLDESGYPGLNTATWHMWGTFDSPTPNDHNRITYNKIAYFLEDRWDGGMIYTTGQQAHSAEGALLIKGNVGLYKRKSGGGNIIYTDGGSRYIQVERNVSLENPIGKIDMGPEVASADKLKPTYYKLTDLTKLNIPYGGACGGCRTYGDITWKDNYWNASFIPLEEALWDDLENIYNWLKDRPDSLDMYAKSGFFNVCPFTDPVTNTTYPTDTTFINNHHIMSIKDVPASLLDSAGVWQEERI
ncbi:right-handed parallel beta-helix repeat-containing protein [Roseivirga sp. BDSF3-8]|uniref:right-handed parallel beta-helix repeat-containing protein n=1 Tax=Roseivirga sp. BDSF3-8 TaxID=3241598 RepID=UPI00353236B1